MGLCALQLNQKKFQEKLKGVGQPEEASAYNNSEVFHKMLSWGPAPANYTKVLGAG